MTNGLVRCAWLSVGVHATLFIPWISGQLPAPPRADVVRGESGLQIEWMGPSPSEEKEGDEPREVFSRKLQEVAVNPGAFSLARPLELRNPAPVYPWPARLQGWQGTVVVRIWVSALGRPDRMEVAASSGHALLDETALAALRAWRFVPAQKDSQAAASMVEVPVTFKLDGLKEDL